MMGQPASTRNKNPSFPVRLAAFWQNLSPAWHWAITFFLAGRVLYSAWGAVIWAMGWRLPNDIYFYFDIEPLIDGLPGALLGVWQRWDTIHYLRIANGGYTANDLSAFYPLYPLLGRWISQFTGLNTLPALILVSNLALLGSMALVYAVVRRYYPETIARDSLAVMLFFPTSFYFYAAYPQSLLLFWILLSFWFALEKKWLAAAVINLLAGLTHSTAVLLTVLLGWQALQFVRSSSSPWRWTALLAAITNFLGIAVFMAWREAVGFLPYAVLQEQYFDRVISLPWDAVINFIGYILRLPPRVAYLIHWIGAGIFVLAVVFTLRAFRQMPWSFWLYQAALVIFLVLTSFIKVPLLAFLRYSLIMFPLFIEIALFTQDRNWKRVGFALALTLSLICSAMFFLWRGDII